MIFFFQALLLTIFLEYIVIRLLTTKKDRFSHHEIKLFIGVAFASILTLPYLRFVFPHFLDGTMYYVAGEAIITLVEGIFYTYFFSFSFKRALILSILANMTSFLLGLLIF